MALNKIFKTKKVERYEAKYKSKNKWQGRHITFQRTFDKMPPKTIKGEHGIIFERVGKPKRKKVTVKQIGNWTFG
ncbi:MAG: hypothetical protein ACOCRX_04195 [Candidatus Woesearchaeota archaeon]